MYEQIREDIIFVLFYGQDNYAFKCQTDNVC